jgi:lysozyme family protein
MQHPFVALEPEYARLLDTVQITRPRQVAAAADEIERHLDTYLGSAKTSGIPAAWIGPTDYRESDCDQRTGIGQGDRWDRVSVHVPRGCGPFSSKAEADAFYLHHDHIDDLQGSSMWTLEYAVWGWEKWNGFGPRAHGRLSSYPWAGTQHYDRPPRGNGNGGKYVADGVWSGSVEDSQCGTVPVYLELVRRHPELAIQRAPLRVGPTPSIIPIPVPVGVGGGTHGTTWIQNSLIRIDHVELAVDGNYGRRTREAVRAFQRAHGLDQDGLAGPRTIAALEAQLWKLTPAN